MTRRSATRVHPSGNARYADATSAIRLTIQRAEDALQKIVEVARNAPWCPIASILWLCRSASPLPLGRAFLHPLLERRIEIRQCVGRRAASSLARRARSASRRSFISRRIAVTTRASVAIATPIARSSSVLSCAARPVPLPAAAFTLQHRAPGFVPEVLRLEGIVARCPINTSSGIAELNDRGAMARMNHAFAVSVRMTSGARSPRPRNAHSGGRANNARAGRTSSSAIRTGHAALRPMALTVTSCSNLRPIGLSAGSNGCNAWLSRLDTRIKRSGNG